MTAHLGWCGYRGLRQLQIRNLPTAVDTPLTVRIFDDLGFGVSSVFNMRGSLPAIRRAADRAWFTAIPLYATPGLGQWRLLNLLALLPSDVRCSLTNSISRLLSPYLSIGTELIRFIRCRNADRARFSS